MNALHKSIDETLAAIRDEHVTQLNDLEKRCLLAEQTTATALQERERAVFEKEKWMRIATRLIAELSTVESVLANVKVMAVQYAEEIARHSPEPATKTDAQAALEQIGHNLQESSQ